MRIMWVRVRRPRPRVIRGSAPRPPLAAIRILDKTGFVGRIGVDGHLDVLLSATAGRMICGRCSSQSSWSLQNPPSACANLVFQRRLGR